MKKNRMMIQWAALLLALAMALSLAACGAAEAPKTEEPQIADALALLNTVWESYAEEERFPAAGGDFANEENSNMAGPGKFGLEDRQSLDSVLALPESAADMVDGAASLMHMMNANTFTCGAFHIKEGADAQALADALKENIAGRQWICGFPDKLIILKVSDYIVSAFGNEEIIQSFKEKTEAAYPTAELLYEEAIA